jgi:preflagellin peptidase FlaK
LGACQLHEIFAAARVTVTLVFLLYASWRDYKTREVSNRVWALYAPIAAVLSVSEILLFESSQIWIFGLSFGLTTVFALLLFYTGGFGGADSKAFICMALALPFFPVAIIRPLLDGGLSPISEIVFPVTILSNSVLIAAASAVYLLLRNLILKAKTGTILFEGSLAKESMGKKILVLLTGKKFPISVLKEKWHVYPMEDILEEVENKDEVDRKLLVVPRDECRDEVVARLSKAAAEGTIGARVWATPGLPMLIFVTVGLIIALVFGDIVWVLVSHLFG